MTYVRYLLESMKTKVWASDMSEMKVDGSKGCSLCYIDVVCAGGWVMRACDWGVMWVMWCDCRACDCGVMGASGCVMN